jgi:4-amino-4-deoxychorismate lyase
MAPLFETIRIEDGVPQHLAWHQARMEDACFRYFGKKGAPVVSEVSEVSELRKVPGVPLLHEVLQVPDEFREGTVKCRFLYGSEEYTAEYSLYTPRKIRSLKLVNGDHLDYSLKYTDRRPLEQLLEQRGDCDEILIVRGGRITDTSYTNIVLFDGERWVTPETPLLSGTCRARLLSEGRIVGAHIATADLRKYQAFRLINAMLPFDAQEALPVEMIKG